MTHLQADSVHMLKLVAAAASQSNQGAGSFLWIAMGVLAVIAWIAITRWNDQRRNDGKGGRTPKALLQELSVAHHLNHDERALLTEAATAKGLQEPAMLFVDSRLLLGLSQAGGPRSKAYAALAQKLFAQT